MHREEKLLQLQIEQNSDDRMDVYWLVNGKRIKPALLSGVPPISDLFEFLRDNYGRQSYCVMIRRKKTMILTHEVDIGVPLVHSPARDIRSDIETLRQGRRLR
ncbi:MAG TPA: hypothetical protein DDZ68_16715 [Parvularcula sp.]|nr:hypothetical protein [Parvularcula sp.]HBS36001.1 hypothetical protein [Parvularcula sp.]